MYKVYYRDSITKKLHQVNADEKTPKDAISAVENMLKEDKEPYHKPILALIQGGKK